MLWNNFTSTDTVAIDLANSDGTCVKLFGMQDPIIYNIKVNATGFPQEETIAAGLDAPNVTVAPPEQDTPSKPVEDTTACNEMGVMDDMIHNIPSHFMAFVSHLVMGLVLIPLVAMYYTAFKPLVFALGFYTNISDPQEYVNRSFNFTWHTLADCSRQASLSPFLSEYKYAMYFWLAIAIITVLEPFVSSALMAIRNILHNHHEQPAATHSQAIVDEMKKKLCRLLGKVYGHGVLIRDLGEQQDSHALSLAGHTTSLGYVKVWLSRLGGIIQRLGTKMEEAERKLSNVSQILVQHDADIKQLEQHIVHVDDDQTDIANNASRTTGIHNDIDHVANTSKQGAQLIRNRMNIQESKIEQLEYESLKQFNKMISLRHENSMQATEIHNLRSDSKKQAASIRDLQSESAAHATGIANLKDDNAAQEAQIKGLKHENTTQAGEIHDLKDQLAAQATEMDGLKKTLAEEQKDKTSIITFCKKYVFTQKNANEYYQRTISAAPDNQLAPYFSALMTGMNMQIAVMCEIMGRLQMGDPSLPKYKQQQHQLQHQQQQARNAMQPGVGYGMQQGGYAPQQGNFGTQQPGFGTPPPPLPQPNFVQQQGGGFATSPLQPNFGGQRPGLSPQQPGYGPQQSQYSNLGSPGGFPPHFRK